MKTAIKWAAAMALVLPALASAPGIALFTLSRATVTQAHLAAIGFSVKSAVAVDINPLAIESTVVTVPLDGKEIRFVGSKIQTDGAAVLWYGTAQDGSTLYVHRMGNKASANFQIPTKYMSIWSYRGLSILTEPDVSNAVLDIDPPSPAAIAASAAANKPKKGNQP